MAQTRHRMILLIAVSLIFAGCGASDVRELEREHRFSLSIGKSANRLDLFQLPGYRLNQRTYTYIQSGLVYISNGPANKVLKFNSYGDLVDLIYSPQDNPEPLIRSPEDGEQISRRFVSYPFQQIGHVAVTANNRLVVEDRLPPGQEIVDNELGLSLFRVARLFDSRLRPEGYLGQGGLGGRPFPIIDNIEVTSNNDIVVLCSSLDSKHVYWFNEAGKLRYSVDIASDRLPVPSSQSEQVPILERIFPDRENDILYLKVNYLQRQIDPNTGAEKLLHTQSQVQNLTALGKVLITLSFCWLL